jgi:GH24 family phage-related lysozyme (muramidase)
MRVSPAGIDLVKSFESLRLEAYGCPAGDAHHRGSGSGVAGGAALAGLTRRRQAERKPLLR